MEPLNSTSVQSSLYIIYKYLFLNLIHTRTDGRGCHAKYQPARQKQLRVQCFIRRLFDMFDGGSWGPNQLSSD